jgi:putative ABC transport system permease protein
MFGELIARVRSLVRGTVRTNRVDTELQEEFRLHIEMRAADLVRAGMTPAEAARKARAEFGSTEDHVEKARRARGLAWFDELRFSWLDVKLGARMLLKYPVLTIVGGFSMAFAIWVGAGTFEAIRQLVFPSIPLPDGDRIVVLRNWDAATSRAELRSTHDFVAWRDALGSVEDLGAFRTLARNLMITEGQAEPVFAAEISAAAFRVVRVPPLLGRPLVDSDERAEAPLVAVIGYDLWQSRFQGDSGVIGRTVRITSVPATIVGVMPKGFTFPRTHEMWTPLKLDLAGFERRQGIAIRIIGRLAPGATLAQAQAELTNLGRVAAASLPRTHEHLRPQIQTFAQSVATIGGEEGVMLLSGNVFVVMLLILVCANVALLMFARAATRETEIVVRSALGASRKRIVMQLFAEALVLGTVAGIVGLTAAGYGMRWALSLMQSEIADGIGRYPFWVDGELSPLTFLYTALLTILAAVIAGVVPGLKITRNLGDRLKRATAGGGGPQFGGVWTAVIVAQLAVTMGFPVATFFVRKDAKNIETRPLPFPVDQYLSVRLEMERFAPDAAPADTSMAAFQARFVAAAAELEERLEADPAVAGVVLAEHLPRQYHPNHQIEVDHGAVTPRDERGHVVASVDVDPKYFDVLGVSMLSGRGFSSSDARPNARVAIVNKPFVDRVLGGKNPIGRRIRYVSSEFNRTPTTEGPWYEIIGVAPDVGTISGWGPAGIYHPLVRTSMYPISAAIHVRGDPAAFAPRLRAIATDVDVTLRLAEVMPLRDVVNAELSFYAFWVRITTIVSVIVLVLSLVAIYAVMSFAVSRRTREIGVRVALGASPRRIVGAVFAQPLRQLALGLLAGVALVAFLLGATKGGAPSLNQFLVLAGYTLATAAVCLIACVVPTRRALAVEPVEALREN